MVRALVRVLVLGHGLHPANLRMRVPLPLSLSRRGASGEAEPRVATHSLDDLASVGTLLLLLKPGLLLVRFGGCLILLVWCLIWLLARVLARPRSLRWCRRLVPCGVRWRLLWLLVASLSLGLTREWSLRRYEGNVS